MGPMETSRAVQRLRQFEASGGGVQALVERLIEDYPPSRAVRIAKLAARHHGNEFGTRKRFEAVASLIETEFSD